MFKELFPKLLKWVSSVMFLIIGLKMMTMTKNGETWALFGAIVSFGFVYWQYNASNKMPWQVLLLTVLILAGAGAATLYAPIEIPYFPFTTGIFGEWFGYTALIGIPVISYGFNKYD